MKFIIVALATLSLVGCGAMSKQAASISGQSIKCVDGVKYIQFPSGATVKIDKDTLKPELC